MADEPKKVTVQASRIDASILPPGFSLPYRLYVIQQTTDMKNIADASNNANDLAFEATVKNEEQDVELADHEQRITGNTNAIALLEVRLTTAEGKIVTLRSDVDYLLDEVIDIQADIVTIDGRIDSNELSISQLQGDYISKTVAANQSVQTDGGALLIGNVTSPTTDKLQIAGSVNASVSYKVSGTQVLGQRQTGWTTSTGTALPGAFNANLSQTISATFVQAEVQTLNSLIVAARQRIKALEDAMRAHGLIN